jgi:hypothetical protein
MSIAEFITQASAWWLLVALVLLSFGKAPTESDMRDAVSAGILKALRQAKKEGLL